MKERLIEAAVEVRNNAYAPYSGYTVGAALLTSDGQVFVGCNVENQSYGATICAERGAVVSMIAAGHKSIDELVVTTEDGGTPCGMCLQVLAEFVASPEVRVHLVDAAGHTKTLKFSEFLPQPFRFR